MTRKPLPETSKPTLDEGSFQQLLAAAYVLQQHTDRLIVNEPEANPTRILSEIVEIQKLTEAENLDVQATAQIIAERLKAITSATGVAISLVDGSELEYVAALGKAAAIAGSRIPVASSPSADAIQAINSPSSNSEAVVKPLIRRIADGGSFLSVPFKHGFAPAGAVELRFELLDIPENDMAAAQLMAGLMGDAVARSLSLRHEDGATASASMTDVSANNLQEAFNAADSGFISESRDAGAEKQNLQPQISNFTAGQETPRSTSRTSAAAMDPVCHSCGHHFSDDEYFCGSCGLTRFVAETADDGLQSKWASLWYLQQSGQAESGNGGSALHPSPKLDGHEDDSSVEALESLSNETHSLGPAVFEKNQTSRGANGSAGNISNNPLVDNNSGRGHSLGSYQQFGEWISQQWRHYRSELYLGVSAILLIAALSGWGTKSSDPANLPAAGQTMRRRNPPKPKLTAFEQVLVGLGLAEPPPTPAYQGNPDTKVWIDLHTALYYCPGTDLYGATTTGRMTSQRSAQLDEFQPADRKPCD